MLSKTSIVITGMLLQGEMNAYDMLKMIDNMNAVLASDRGDNSIRILSAT